MPREYNFPVFTTQGGGLVRVVRDTFIFVEKPNCPGLDVGNEMPEEWGIQPANKLAREFMGTDLSNPLEQAPGRATTLVE